MHDRKSEHRLQPITFLIDQKKTNRNRASYLQPVFNFRPPLSYEGMSLTVVNIHINPKNWQNTATKLQYSRISHLYTSNYLQLFVVYKKLVIPGKNGYRTEDSNCPLKILCQTCKIYAFVQLGVHEGFAFTESCVILQLLYFIVQMPEFFFFLPLPFRG